MKKMKWLFALAIAVLMAVPVAAQKTELNVLDLAA